MDIAQMTLRRLRRAIQNNQVSFPSPVPMFRRESRADIQWRVVNLYFLRNWSCAKLGERYRLTRTRTGQILSSWVHCAIESGYLQEIPPSAALLPQNIRRGSIRRVPFHVAAAEPKVLVGVGGALQ